MITPIKKYRYYIGIDPDVDKSGVAIVDKLRKGVDSFTSYEFFRMIEFIRWVKVESNMEPNECCVIVEAGWLNKISTYHTYKDKDGIKRKITGGSAEKIAQHVGRNQQVGILLVEYCKRNGIDVIEAPPLRKGWKGPNGKITHEELAYFTGITGKSNQETRDAILISWEYANLPIKINVNIKKRGVIHR